MTRMRTTSSTSIYSCIFFFNDTATTEIYTLSLHDALPIFSPWSRRPLPATPPCSSRARRSEEHTSELQSQFHLVCRLLLEKKKKHKSTRQSWILSDKSARKRTA